MIKIILRVLYLAFGIVMECLFTASCSKSSDHVWIIPPDDTSLIFLPYLPSRNEYLAAEELAYVLEKMSGRRPVIREESYVFDRPGIYIGSTSLAKKVFPDLLRVSFPLETKQGIHAFDSSSHGLTRKKAESWDTIAWKSYRGKLVICGSDDIATLMAVERLLQLEGGVRWWIPTDLGGDIPLLTSWSIKEQTHIETPSYLSRQLNLGSDMDVHKWAVRNMLRGRVDVNHNLNNIFTRYIAKQHPDWFPTAIKLNESKMVPHPLFHHEKVIEFVADAAIVFFNLNPTLDTFSISPADHTLFGSVEDYNELIDSTSVFRAKSDYSNLIFSFYNRVAKRVSVAYPDRYLGALAYAFWENVPKFSVESNIIPYLTADRSQWYDRDFMNDDLSLVRKWSTNGPTFIGTWDYYYGYPYIVPRSTLSSTLDSLPMLHEAGVRCFYAEFFPFWGFDAPKAWISAQLLWDCNQDVEKLKTEFFDGYFGPASKPMRAFFEECDRVWMNQPGKAHWIKYFGNPDQITLYSPAEIVKLRAMISEAQALDLTEKYRKRVELTSEAFTYTERFSKAWHAKNAISRWTPNLTVEKLVGAIPDYLDACADMTTLNDQLSRPGLNGGYGKLGYLVDDDPLAGRLALAQKSLSAEQRSRLLLLASPYGRLVSERSLMFFTHPFENGLDNWRVTHWPNPLLKYSLGWDGKSRVLHVSHAQTFSLIRNYGSIKEDAVYSVAFGVSGRLTPGAMTQLVMKCRDKDGKTLKFYADRLPCGDLKHALLAVAGAAPKGTATVRVELTIYYQAPDDELVIEPWPVD